MAICGSKINDFFFFFFFFVGCLTNVKLFANVTVLKGMVGALPEHIGNNIIGDKPLDAQRFGANMLNGLLQSFVPGSWNSAVSSAFSNLEDWMLDPSKSLSEKWQVGFFFHFFFFFLSLIVHQKMINMQLLYFEENTCLAADDWQWFRGSYLKCKFYLFESLKYSNSKILMKYNFNYILCLCFPYNCHFDFV